MNDEHHIVWRNAWERNPALAQLLGLCPLLAVTSTVVNGLVLGLATLAVLLATNTALSLLRHAIAPSVRIPLFVLVIAAFVTSVDLLVNAYFDDIYQILGLFIPLIVTNCAILGQAETVASRNGVGLSAAAALGAGIGFTGTLVALGALREAIGRGTLLAGFDMLFGPAAAGIEIKLPNDGALAAALPPGAFFGLALLVAGRQALLLRRERRRDER
jgi:electron transport complex protein RnfE